MNTALKQSFCISCGGSLPEAARFCPQCGSPIGAAPQKRPALTPKRIGAILVVAGAIFGFAWTTQLKLAGVAPTGAFQPAAESKDAPLSAELTKLIEAARARPDDIAGWRVLSGALIRELQSSEQPSNQIIFETMEVLTNILRLDPKDPNALIAFADLSFNQQVFDKAVGLYERYLAVEPDDHNARSRYASALAFTQKFPAAVKELKTVLSKDPSNFHASAYLAITYAQMGSKADAIAAGERAIKLAPNEEAKARFADFLKTVRAESSAAAAEPAVRANNAPPSASEPGVVAYLRSNPVAGPKFVRFEGNGPVVKVFFRDFPMEQMPPFAKEKFFAGVRGAAAGLSTIIFVDEATGRELDKVSVQ